MVGCKAIRLLLLAAGCTVVRLEKQLFPPVKQDVGRLVKEGFFEKLFGPGIKAEEERKARLAFR